MQRDQAGFDIADSGNILGYQQQEHFSFMQSRGYGIL